MNSNSNPRCFPCYTITPHTTRNDTRNNKPLSVIPLTHTNVLATAHTRTHDSHTRNRRYSLGYLIACMVISCTLGLIVMQNYIISNQRISATPDGYISTIFGEDYLYR